VCRIVPFLSRRFDGQRLKGERKHLTDGCPVETQSIVRLHILIRDTQEILNNGRIVLWDVEENESLSSTDVAVSNSTVDHVREYLSDHGGNEAGGIKFKCVAFLVNDIASQIHLV
jgi:hypothetical protein